MSNHQRRNQRKHPSPSVKTALTEGFLTGKAAYFKVFPISLCVFALNQVLLATIALNFQANLNFLMGFFFIIVFFTLTVGSTLSLIFTTSTYQQKNALSSLLGD